MIRSLEELERVRGECQTMVTYRALASAGAAAVPVPGVDFAADMSLMLELIPAINRRFGLTRDQIDELDPQTREKIAVIITSLGSNLIGSYITKELIIQMLKRAGISLGAATVAKYIPFIGTAFSSSVSFGVMKYLGNSHVDDCYNVIKRLFLLENNH